MLGLFGGTFDPVHFGHLRLATELREAFGLERIVFLPAGQPWQKGGETFAGGDDRIRMLQLATAGEPAFSVDDREVRRPGPTYTVDTLAEFRREAGPAAPIVFLCGADAFAGVETWHRWPSLLDLAHFAVATRAGEAAGLALPAALLPRRTENPRDLTAAPAGRIMSFAMTPLAISSTALRGLARSAASLRYLTPDPVVDYIHQRSLYGTRGFPAKQGQSNP
jgi:nicotinate-nucleotide adenylyltransferase